jgi:hypothetical protein
MEIVDARLVAEQVGGSSDLWRLTVHWSERFTAQEIQAGFEFEDWITFWEWDDVDHDWILNGPADRFQPTSLKHRWEWPFTIPGDDLDTELGGEEIRAQVFLRNRTTSSAPISVFTPILQISPG